MLNFSSGDFLAGFATGAALIVAIGSQNAFVLRKGILGEHVATLVAFCALSDAFLIAIGVAGAGVVVQQHPILLAVSRYGGAIFLALYASKAAMRAYRGEQMEVGVAGGGSLPEALAACFAFTYLNPHVYLDTVVLLGAIANQRGMTGDGPVAVSLAPWVFAVGAMLSSLLWFCLLGFGARYLRPLFETARAWQVLDTLIAFTMAWMAASLVL